MTPNSQLPEHIRAALAAEERARGLAWLPTPPDLLGVPQRHLTARSRNDLVLQGNAFFTGRPAAAADVFFFLWRHHPAYLAPARPLLLRRARASRWRFLWLWRAFGSLRVASAYYLLETHVARLDPRYAAAHICDYLLRVFQDRPAAPLAETTDQPPPLFPPPEPYWLDNFVDAICSRYGALTPEAVLDYPLARFFQLHRNVAILRGEDVIDPARALWSAHVARLRTTGALAAARTARN